MGNGQADFHLRMSRAEYDRITERVGSVVEPGCHSPHSLNGVIVALLRCYLKLAESEVQYPLDTIQALVLAEAFEHRKHMLEMNE